MEEAELVEIAAMDLGETSVEAILDHRGGHVRTQIEFLVLWSDGDTTWEPWETVKKLAVLEEYVQAHPQIRSLAARKRSGEVCRRV
jgi:hypothetical protein